MSAADKLHNARSILDDYGSQREELWGRFNRAAGRPGSLWYYRRLADVLSTRLVDDRGLGQKLCKAVDELVDEVQGSLGPTVDLEAEYIACCAREAALRSAASGADA